MGIFSNEYMMSKDIDWFFNVNGVSFHVASGGSILPEFINNIENLRELHSKIIRLPEICSTEEISNNEDFLFQYASSLEYLNSGDIKHPQHLSIEEMINEYLSSFRRMALKGFVSLDKTNLYDPYDFNFHLVCHPTKLFLVDNIDIPTIEKDINIDILLSNNSFDLYSIMNWQIKS